MPRNRYAPIDSRIALFLAFAPIMSFAQQPDDKDAEFGRYYMCVFGPDSLGNYYEEIVNEKHAQSCDKFCVCHDLKTTCLVGPDSVCNFATVEVERDFAETCDRDSCTCTSHSDYMKVANYRLSGGGECKSARTGSTAT